MGFIRGDYLQKQDACAAPHLVDIHSEEFSIRYPDIDPVEADRLLYGRLQNGQMLYGLGVSCMSCIDALPATAMALANVCFFAKNATPAIGRLEPDSD